MNFINRIICLAFSIYAGFASGIGTVVLLEERGLSGKFEGLGLIVGIAVLTFTATGLLKFMEDMDKKDKKR